MIHEGLYRSDNLLDIQFESYVRNLATDLCRFYSVEDIDIQLVVEVQDVRLGLDSAVPCGLIINELVTNCLKHGFVGQQGVGQVRITFREDGRMASLEVADTGQGLPDDFSAQESGSMGMEIVSILTEQLDGTLKYRNEGGAVFTISFPRESGE